ncbi:hypothetical protein EDC04DRAFT_2773530, partial [Pisolithus marmoratus]
MPMSLISEDLAMSRSSAPFSREETSQFTRETLGKNAMATLRTRTTVIHPYPTLYASTPLSLESDIILELSDQPNIVGTKLSCGNIGKFQEAPNSLHSP